MKEKKQNFAFGIATLIIVLFLTIGYSAFERNLLLDDIALTVRPIEDIRVTGTWQKESTNGAESSSVDYNVKSSLLSFNLPKENSTITYTVQVTNIGNVDMGILKITGLPENMEYELTNYKLKEKICSEERCSRGIQKEFQITIKYKSGGYDSFNTNYNIKLDYDFQRVWNIKYDGFDEEEIKDMPTEVLNSDTLVLQFDESIIEKISVEINDEEFQDYKVEKGTLTIENITSDITIIKEIDIIVDFTYDENNLEQTYIVPRTGYYKLEVWGASGGTADSTNVGGQGGYSVGAVYLEKGQTLYINLGGKGSTVSHVAALAKGGYNGGGSGFASSSEIESSGGGATHIAKVSGLLSTLFEQKADILIVAGGGAGAGTHVHSHMNGGAGGGSKGGGNVPGAQGYGYGEGSFGQGQNVTGPTGSGGGGGYYGGGSAWYNSGGGSGYIGGVTNYGDVVAKTTAGGHTGNGSAKITFLKAEKVDKKEEKFFYTGGEQTYVVPTTGYYKLEVWGAQGGTVSASILAGTGGYSVGAVYLEKGQTLYINVGGVGTTLGYKAELVEGGYNGGGSGFGSTSNAEGSGGGATHIATVSGELSTLSEKIANILIVAGGGAGSGTHGGSQFSATGGVGGGTSAGGNVPGTQGYGYGVGSFGQGQNITGPSAAGGGGGYYGGGNNWYRAGGGSGYIGGVTDYGDIVAQTLSGSSSFPTINDIGNETGHQDSGCARITFIKDDVYEKKDEQFYYTGGEQKYVVPTTGYYKLEVWGAQGGSVSSSILGGKGGYSVGAVYLEKGQTLYINVGGVGSTISEAKLVEGGYNGGGSGFGASDVTEGSGGGATHIATVSGQLSTLSKKMANLLIVAGGGGGSGTHGGSKFSASGGVGGGTSGGGNGDSPGTQYPIAGRFGQGQNITSSSGAGGGGGYYGGSNNWYSSGGGSGYIGGVTDYDEVTAQTTSGKYAFPTVNGKGTETGHVGHGFAKITFLKSDEKKETDEKFYYTGEEQTYVVPTTGYYKLEVWGAQGGSVSSSITGGTGGYSVGAVYLEEGQTLYINVGGVGSIATGAFLAEGGYNGGGSGFGSTSNTEGSGGGATHIATTSGVLSTLSEKIDNLLIVAGGGAGSGTHGGSSFQATGGVGGGTSGSGGDPGTQTPVEGRFGQGQNITGPSGAGGGGGYYGGGNNWYRSGGGSGYIGGVTSYGDVVVKTISGGSSFPTVSGKGTETGHVGHGFAKITFIE